MLDTLSLSEGHLGQPLVDRYWQDGYLFPIQALSPDDAAAARAELETIERDWGPARRSTTGQNTAPKLPHSLNIYKRVNAHVVMPFAARIAKDPRVLDVIEGILGPDILVYAAEFFVKEAQSPQVVSMHQDLTYWGLGATQGLVTAWIALSPSTPASGCMNFVRASHKNPILPHTDSDDANNLLSRGQEVHVDVAPKDRVPIEIHPGQMSLHHGLTIHGSGPNTSDDRRIALVIRYCRPDVMQEVGDEDHAMLARGEDRYGNFTLIPEPTELFAPEALKLYDHIRREQAKVMMRGTKAKVGDNLYR